MFRNQIDRNEADRPCYSESIDCLAALGSSYITSMKSGLEDELRARWKRITGSPGLEEDAEAGLRVLADEAARALDYLDGEATLDIDPEYLENIPAALEVLDDVASIAIFLNHVDNNLGKIPHNISRNAEMLYLEVSTERIPPCHRLIPVNPWRREIKASFLPEYAYFFNWYDQWSQVPENTLDDIIQHWSSLYSDSPDYSYLDMDERLAEKLLQIIREDSRLFHFLKKRAELNLAISATLADSTYLRLAAFAGVAAGAYDNPLPEIVTQKGFQAAACRIMKKRLSSLQDKYETMLLAAFFGPDLDRSARMELFRETGQWLDGNPHITRGSLAWELEQWRGNALYGAELMSTAMKVWTHKLEAEAKRMSAPVPYRAGAFEEAIADLRAAKPVSFLDAIGDRIKEFARGLKIPVRDLLGLDPAEALANMMKELMPPPLSLAAADSGGVKCVAVIWNGQESSYEDMETEALSVEKIEDDSAMWTWSCRIIPLNEACEPDEYECCLFRNGKPAEYPISHEIECRNNIINLSAMFRLDKSDEDIVTDDYELSILMIFRK